MDCIKKKMVLVTFLWETKNDHHFCINIFHVHHFFPWKYFCSFCRKHIQTQKKTIFSCPYKWQKHIPLKQNNVLLHVTTKTEMEENGIFNFHFSQNIKSCKDKMQKHNILSQICDTWVWFSLLQCHKISLIIK